MPVERSTPSTSGRLIIRTEPGTLITARELPTRDGLEVDLTVWGTLGARFLSSLVEEATALRDELRDIVG